MMTKKKLKQDEQNPSKSDGKNLFRQDDQERSFIAVRVPSVR